MYLPLSFVTVCRISRALMVAVASSRRAASCVPCLFVQINYQDVVLLFRKWQDEKVCMLLYVSILFRFPLVSLFLLSERVYDRSTLKLTLHIEVGWQAQQ